jgi:hypothetical protein
VQNVRLWALADIRRGGVPNVRLWWKAQMAAFEREREVSVVQRCSLNGFPPVNKNEDRSSDCNDA